VSTDELVVVAVIAMRLAVPLLILRYPLPGILAAILADAVDGAIFAGVTGAPLEGYQNFDKALDTWYLAFAYFAMVRNWADPEAVRIGRLLWYYRLLGVAIFSVADDRIWLFLFPAVFEIYFIYYEVVRTRWWPERVSRGHLVRVALVAFVLVKLPQEYWIHVVQGSTTEWLKERVFGVEAAASRLDALAADPVAGLALAGLVLAIPVLARIGLALLPAGDHPFVVDADSPVHGERAEPVEAGGSGRWAVAEKIVMIALIGLIFSEFLPGIRASAAQMFAAAVIAVVAGAAFSARLPRAPRDARMTALEFGGLTAVGLPAILLMARVTELTVDASTAMFYVMLFSLLIIAYDRSGAQARGRAVLILAGAPVRR
jgi:hypothetical protein